VLLHRVDSMHKFRYVVLASRLDILILLTFVKAVENGYGVSKSKLTKPQIREALKVRLMLQKLHRFWLSSCKRL
jgi:hypothetical protein